MRKWGERKKKKNERTKANEMESNGNDDWMCVNVVDGMFVVKLKLRLCKREYTKKKKKNKLRSKKKIT